MNAEEALAMARDLDESFILFDADTGEVLDVRAVADRPNDRLASLAGMSRERPTVGRFFKRGALTAAVLEAQRRECIRIAARKRLIPVMERASAQQIVRLLQGREPLDADIFDLAFEARWLTAALFGLHRDELTSELVDGAMYARLALEPPTRTLIEAYAAGWRGDREALWLLWPSDRPSMCPWFALAALLDGYARIDERSPAYVNALIGLMGKSPFSGWFPVVTALGRVGVAAGDRAARAVRQHVFDSQPSIKAIRDLALDRIETPEHVWERCVACDFGAVVERSPDRWRRRSCDECLGLGFVRKS